MASMREDAEIFMEHTRQMYLKVKLPSLLFETMKQSAKKHRRTLNDEIIIQLVNSYAGERTPTPSNIEQIMRLR